MKIYNHKVLIKPDETEEDIIAELCCDFQIGPDEYFAFSAIQKSTIQKTAKGKPPEKQTILKINYFGDPPLASQDINPFTPVSLVQSLHISEQDKSISFVQPPINIWLNHFAPALHKMVEKAFPTYRKIFYHKDELLSILYLVVIQLYHRKYYLNQGLIYRSFINELNMQARKLIPRQNDLYLSSVIGETDDGEEVTLMDKLEDPVSSEWGRDNNTYTVADHLSELFDLVKRTMLQEMSELSFERILHQLDTKTISPDVAKLLQKYRKKLCPDLSLRPNRGSRKKPTDDDGLVPECPSIVINKTNN